MSKTFQQVADLISRGEVRISAHGYEELAEDDILAKDAVTGALNGTVVEDYPEFHKGPSVLVLQQDANDQPIHVVWGIPKGKLSPAVLVTAYRPDPARWSRDFTRRKI
ncbi:MAG TPA: DUF4258 domain-containing protein [Anaerolineae bacterium]|nr:DUF4258 domain-containing protein [Chloroflexota bacterium]HIP72564.1 DUF4258 domain-containing protein [Anaerolineae bacterium]